MEVLSHGRGFLVPEKGPGSSPGSGDTATVIVSLVEPKVGGEPGRKKSGSKVESTSNQTDFGPAAPSDSGWLGGRDDVVQQVEELLRSGEFPLLVLCGGPGHGKSTVARAVASRLVAGSFWCNTGSSCICNLRMLQDPVEVSGHIGVAIGAITNAQRRRSGFSVAELTAYLSRHHRREDERLGVVLDDADYLTLGEAKRIEFHQVLKRIIDSSDSVQLLLTSQQPIRVPGEEVPCVLVPHLSNDSARAVLARLAPGIKADQAAELASMAGGIPGTLYAVSCAIGAGMPADELIKQARQQGNLHSVRQEAYGGGGHLASLVDACSYSMGTLVREYRDALVLLGIFPSMFDVEGAAAILGASRKVMVTGLLKVLTQAHMVLPAGKGYYYVHPLVRDVLSSEVAEFEAQGRYEEARCRFVQHFGELFRRVGQEYRNCARNSGAHLEFQKHRGSIDVMMSWVGTSKQPANSEALYCKLLWTSWDLLQLLMGLPELETLTRQCVAMSQDMNDQYAEARALVMDSWVLVHQGRYQVALEELARAKEILEATCAPGHEDLATEMLVRGMALSSRGSFAEAREVLELALEVRKAAFGEDHPETAEVKCYLASILTDLAEYEYANRLHEAALAVRTDALGTDHPAVALSRLRLGQLQALCGQWIEAEKNFRRTIDICQGLSGSESELVAASLAGLAQFRFAEGFADEARMLAKRSKEVYEKALGNRHPQIAEPLLVLSHLGLSQGNVQEVEESIMQSVEVTHQHLRSDHPRVLAALNALGSFKRCKGDLEDAAILHSSVHKHVVNSLGTEHPLMATTCCHMASVREAQGNHKHALALLHQARKILEAVHGNDKHPAMVAIWGGISSVKMAQGDRDAAGHYYTKILEMSGSEEKPGCAGFFAPVAYNNLAVMMKAKGDLKQAEALYRRSLALTERSYGQGHISVAKSLNNLALLLMDKASYADSEELYRRASMMVSQQLGHDHVEVATSLNGLAVVMKKQGKLQDAVKLYRGALDIQQKQLPENHPDLAVTYNNLASLQQSQGQFDSSELNYRHALDIRMANYGEAHATVATSLSNLASLMNDMGRYDEGEELYTRGMRIREEVLGKEHQDVAQSLVGLAKLYRNTGQRVLSEQYHRRALKLREDVLGPSHLQVAESCDGLAALLADLEEDEVTPLAPTPKGVSARFRKALSLKRGKGSKRKPLDAEVQEAEALYRRAIDVRKDWLGVSHPEMASSLNGLALILKRKKSYKESERIYRMAVNISERNHGAWHPSVGTSMHELAELLDRQEKYAEAEPLYRRSLEVWEATLGKNHPHVAVGLGNLARLLRILGRDTEAMEVEELAETATRNSLKTSSVGQ